MLTLQEAKEKTEKVFDGNGLCKFVGDIDYKRKIEVFKEANLSKQSALFTYKKRCKYVEDMGFAGISLDEAVKMLTRKSHIIKQTFYHCYPD